MARGPVAERLARNALTGGGRFVVAAVVALIVTPYALHTLGNELFGLWALAGALLATVRVLDLGLNRSLTRAVADASGRDDVDDAARSVAAGRVLAVAVGLVVVAVVWMLIDPIVTVLLRLPPDLQPLARRILMGTAVVAAIEGALAPFQSALDGVGRMDMSNGIDTAQRILSGVGTVLVLALGWGLIGLVIKNLVTAIAAGGAYWWALHGVADPLLGKRPGWDVRRMRKLLKFGRHVQAVAVSSLVMDVGGKLLLGRGPGLDSVALYELAMRVVTQAGGAVVAMAMALFPEAAHTGASAATQRLESLISLYRGGARRLGWLSFPTFALIVALAGPFVGAWLGTGFDQVQRSMQVLAVGWLVASVAIPAHLIAQAGGRPRISVWGAAATTIVALLFGVLLVGPFGLAGVVGAIAAGLVVGALVVWTGFARSFGTGSSTIGVIGWRAPASATVGAACAWATMAAAAAVYPSVTQSLVAVAAAAALGLAVYTSMLFGTGEASHDDWATLRGALSPKGVAGGMPWVEQSPTTATRPASPSLVNRGVHRGDRAVDIGEGNDEHHDSRGEGCSQ